MPPKKMNDYFPITFSSRSAPPGPGSTDDDVQLSRPASSKRKRSTTAESSVTTASSKSSSTTQSTSSKDSSTPLNQLLSLGRREARCAFGYGVSP